MDFVAQGKIKTKLTCMTGNCVFLVTDTKK